MGVSTPNQSVMMICPNLKCRKVLQVPSKCRGKHVKCHFCGTTFGVPLAKSEPRVDGEKQGDGQKTQEDKK
ncbi:MAG: hypothetical protein ABII12_14070 [Planctomycetota bacterium]